MTTLHIHAHVPAVPLPDWVASATLGILLGLVLLLLRVDGVAAPDLTLPISPFFAPGGPDLYSTTT